MHMNIHSRNRHTPQKHAVSSQDESTARNKETKEKGREREKEREIERESETERAHTSTG